MLFCEKNTEQHFYSQVFLGMSRNIVQQDTEMRRAMTGNMNILSTISGDTEKAMEGIVSRDLQADRVQKGNREVSDTEATDTQVEQEDTDTRTRTVHTKVVTDRLVQEKYQEQKSEERAAQAKTDAIAAQLAWIEENLQPADLAQLEEEKSPYEEYTAGQLERAIRRVKEGRAARQESVERQVEKKQETREQIQDVGLSQTEKKLAERLRTVGIPVTQANLDRLTGALEMTEQAIGRMGDQGYVWMLEHQLESNVSNLYRGSMMGQGITSVGAGNLGQSDQWEQIRPQAETRLEQEGVPVTEATREEARWLFNHGQAIDRHNVAELESLQHLKEQSTVERQEDTMDQLVHQLALGAPITEAVLGDARVREAEYAVNSWIRLEVESIADITARRQIEEIRLKLTTEVAVRLLDQGIRLDTEHLAQIVEGLREQEDHYYRSLCEEQGVEAEEQTVSLLREVAEKSQESLQFSLYAVGSVYRSSGQITLEAFYAEGQSLTASIQVSGSMTESVGSGSLVARAENAYETMATEVRRDLGDSIRKAFRSVDGLLDSMELAVTEANERAVRILGYNHLEITPESVARMSYYDSMVTATLESMKPGVVLQMIRKGQNPLQMTMEELGETVRELTEESPEESYSRFLWKLEKQQGISEEERSAYIGIYRLLHQIEKSDGAAIGAVVEAGQELTLEHLLTAVRSRRSGGIDRKIDDKTGEREEMTRMLSSITEQIAAGYRHPREDVQEMSRQMRRALEQPEESYRQWQTEQLTESLAQSREMIQMVQEYGLESTPTLLAAAKELTGSLTRLEKRITEHLEDISEEERELLRQEGEQILESLTEEPENLQEQIRTLQETLQEQLNRREQRTDLSFERLQQMRTLGEMLNLSGRLARQEHYEIPLVEQDGTVSCIRLTIRQAAETTHGRMEIGMRLPETEEEIKGDFWIREEQIEGYFRAETRQSQEVLLQKTEVIRSVLEEEGFRVGRIHCYLQQTATMEGGQHVKNGRGQTRQMYLAAKTMISVLRHQEGVETE